MLYENGDYYEGDFFFNQKNGQGIFTTASGDIYNCEWKEDKCHGKVKVNYANGNVYEGDFVDGKRTGKGS